MEMTASPAITTPRSSRWSRVSRRESSSSVWSDMGKRVRRPGTGDRKGHAFVRVAVGERGVELLEARLLIAIDQHVDLRKGTLALRARFGDRVAGEAREHFLFDLAD